MGVRYVRYYCYTDTDERRILVVPNWSDSDDVNINRGLYALPLYIADHPTFPLEATWFCATEAQRVAAADLGLPLPVSIEAQITAGTTKWYLDQDKTKYLEFTTSSSAYRISIVYPTAGINMIALSLNPAGLAIDNKTRYSTFISSEDMYNSLRSYNAYVYWQFQSIDNDLRMYYYYTSYFPDAASEREGSIGYERIKTFWDGVEPMNPYTPIEEAGPGGGDGDYDDESEPNPISSAPTISFADAGFCRIYSPALSAVKALAQYLWTDTTFLQTVVNHLKQLLENPMDAIISFSIVPIDMSNYRSTAEQVKVMYIPIPDVYMPPVTQQFIDIDCGELTIQKNIGSALDYNPYTKIHAYLPFIGQVTLDTDEVMGKTLHLTYRIDVVTGICVAFIRVNGNVMYLYSGHCSVTQPLTSADFSGYINAMINAAKLVGGVVAGAGGAPGIAAGLSGVPGPRTRTITETETSAYTTRNPTSGRQVTRGTSSDQFQRVERTEGARFGELATRMASNTVSAVMNSKLVVEHSSGFGGNSGFLAQRYPFVIIERPRLCNPKEYGNYNGYPSMMYLNLGNCSGYTEVQQVQLTGINATNPELSELSELLKSGVIL